MFYNFTCNTQFNVVQSNRFSLTSIYTSLETNGKFRLVKLNSLIQKNQHVCPINEVTKWTVTLTNCIQIMILHLNFNQDWTHLPHKIEEWCCKYIQRGRARIPKSLVRTFCTSIGRYSEAFVRLLYTSHHEGHILRPVLRTTGI